MPIAVCCPGCQKRFNAPDALAGKRAKCSACGGIISIAAPAGPNDAPVAPVQVAPVKVVPVKVVPVKVVPVQTGPINGAPNQAAPIKVAPVRVVPTGSGPATAAGPKVVPTKAAAPRAAAPQATVSPAGGSSLLDLLDQAAAGGAAADPFAAGGYPAGGAKLARSGGRNRFVMPLVIGLGIVGVVGLVIDHTIKFTAGFSAYVLTAGVFVSLNTAIGATRGSGLGAALAECQGVAIGVHAKFGIGYTIFRPVANAINSFLSLLHVKPISSDGGIKSPLFDLVVKDEVIPPGTKLCGGP